MLTVDANGQSSVGYMDQAGRVIATGLSGNSPDNVIGLDNAASTAITADLTGNNVVNREDGVSRSVSKILNTVASTDYTFTYSMAGVLHDFVSPLDICMDCRYDWQVAITDPAGLVVFDTSATFRVDSPFVCSPDSFLSNTYSFTVGFEKIGNYTVTKELKLTENLEAQWMNGVSSSPNYPNLDSIIAGYLSEIDSSYCDFTCYDHYDQDCEVILSGDPGWSSLTAEEKEAAILACTDSLCGLVADTALMELNTARCEDMLEEMEKSVVPDGNGYRYTWWNETISDPATEISFKNSSGTTITPGAGLSDSSLFEKWWIDSLVLYHREYCHYENCQADGSSDLYDIKMMSVTTKAQAEDHTTNYNSYDFLDPVRYTCPAGTAKTGSEVGDPYWDYGAGYTDRCAYYDSVYTNYKGSGLSMWDRLNSTNLPDAYSGIDLSDGTAVANHQWMLWKGQYQELKRRHKQSRCSFYDDENRIVPADPELPGDSASAYTLMSTFMGDWVGDMCEANLESWYGVLSHSCGVTRTDFDDHIAPELLAYCMGSAGWDNPMGLLFSEDKTSNTHLSAVRTYLSANYSGCYISTITRSQSTYRYQTDSLDTICYKIDNADPCLVAMLDYLNTHIYPTYTEAFLTASGGTRTSTTDISTSAVLEGCYGVSGADTLKAKFTNLGPSGDYYFEPKTRHQHRSLAVLLLRRVREPDQKCKIGEGNRGR